MQPVIKWSGSKRSQAHDITSYIGKDYDTYYEPFCGGCAVLAYIIERENLANHFKFFVCSDLNQDLINSYNLIKSKPEVIANAYEVMWHELNLKKNTINDKRKYFEQIRERLNRIHNPLDFIFVMRTTTNGMPRYNKQGEFNNSFHITRNGIEPKTFKKIVMRWSTLLNKYNVQFICQSFEKITPDKNDLMYLDPPYANTKGMYYGNFDNQVLIAFLRGLECDWMLSYDGIAGKCDLTVDLPKDLYKSHYYLKSGNSSFRRVIGKDRHCNVQESLYLNFIPTFSFIF